MDKGKELLCAMVILALLMGNAGPALAGNAEAGFAVWPLLPENQIDADAPYFYLNVKPGEEQVLQIQLSNKYDRDITFSLETNAAYSSSSGLIAYTRSEERDPSLAADFAARTVISEPIVTVPANSDVVTDILLKMPEEPLEGEMLGGIVIAKLPDSEPGTAVANAMITNVYTYVIAVRVRQEDAAMEPAFEVLGVKEGTLAGGPTVVIDIRNPKPLIVKNISLDVTVLSPETGEAALRFTAERLEMAPNSVMPYTKQLLTESLAPGNYQVVSKIVHGESTWEFTSPLEIGGQ